MEEVNKTLGDNEALKDNLNQFFLIVNGFIILCKLFTFSRFCLLSFMYNHIILLHICTPISVCDRHHSDISIPIFCQYFPVIISLRIKEPQMEVPKTRTKTLKAEQNSIFVPLFRIISIYVFYVVANVSIYQKYF